METDSKKNQLIIILCTKTSSRNITRENFYFFKEVTERQFLHDKKKKKKDGIFFLRLVHFLFTWLWQRLPAHSKQEFKSSQISVCEWPSFSYKLSHAFLTLEM